MRVGGIKRGIWREVLVSVEAALGEAGAFMGTPLSGTEGSAEVREQDL